MIGEKLSDEVRDLDNVTACHYHKFCVDTLKKAGQEPLIRENEHEFWDYELPEAFSAYTKENPIKFDAVIVDEGQDFRSEWWVTVADLVKPDGYFYVFYDPGQNVWEREMEFPIRGISISLNRNCRNTVEIFNMVKPFAPEEMKIMETSPKGAKVVEYSSPFPRQRRRQLGRILDEVVNNHEIRPDQIVVLGGHSITNTCIGTNHDVGSFKLTEKLEDIPGIVHYHTYMKFKGCEADIVILLDVDRKDERWSSDTALYTTISRAKHLLYIIYC
jgi:DNA helicase IV